MWSTCTFGTFAGVKFPQRRLTEKIKGECDRGGDRDKSDPSGLSHFLFLSPVAALVTAGQAPKIDTRSRKGDLRLRRNDFLWREIPELIGMAPLLPVVYYLIGLDGFWTGPCWFVPG